MRLPKKISQFERFRLFFKGKTRSIYDDKIFHKMTLIAFFAWIGLGSDGLSSSCYGPEETYRVLSHYPHLSIFVGFAIIFTIFIISSSYSQIIKLFPSGGGGYKVASKLISPNVGMVSGSALIIDYILTISISVASGTDALFSYLPHFIQMFKIEFIVLIIIVLLMMNLRGIKESVISLMPIFMIFVLSHIILIFYALFHHVQQVPIAFHNAVNEFGAAKDSIGLMAVIFLMLRSYTMGAGNLYRN